MSLKAASITKALLSRGTLIITLVVMIASACYALSSGDVTHIIDNKGTLFAAPYEWISNPVTSMWVNLAVIMAIVGLMIYINKVYNIPRSITLVYSSFFAVLQTATPDITAQFGSGTIMAAVIMGAMTVMFSVYGNPLALHRVFMVFFLLSCAVTVQYAFAVYIPVFLLACAQMRILTLRTVLAALLGLLTPWWILVGAGAVTFDDVHLPHFVSVIDVANSQSTLIIAVTIGLTVLLVITAYMMSLLKLMTYNARMRACNGLLTLITVVTILAMAVDFTNFISYLALLNCCTAFFLGHLFVIRSRPRAWVAIAMIIVTYYAIYVWRIFV